MDTLNAFASSSDCGHSEDVFKVLGRVADAFDNPSLHRTDKELLFVVNVVKSRRLLTSPLGKESVYQDESYDSSFDFSYDEDEELRDISIWEHRSSYPYTSRRHRSQEPRSFSKRTFHREDGAHDVTKMLSTSSPLDRLDRLARMELKKTGWVERADKWSIVEMGLPAAPLPNTPCKKASKNAGYHAGEKPGQSTLNKTTSPVGEKHTSRRYGTESKQSLINGPNTPKCSDQIKSSTPAFLRDSGSYPIDFSPLSYVDASSLLYADITTPIGPSCTSQRQARGRLGQVMRNFVKRMLPPSSGGGATSRSNSYPRSRPTGNTKGACGESPSRRTSQIEVTPRSDVSAESGWTLGSASRWMEAPTQGCLDYQATNRWSGFWH